MSNPERYAAGDFLGCPSTLEIDPRDPQRDARQTLSRSSLEAATGTGTFQIPEASGSGGAADRFCRLPLSLPAARMALRGSPESRCSPVFAQTSVSFP
jgi:hypothetical protein